jgi:hypothetical protein
MTRSIKPHHLKWVCIEVNPFVYLFGCSRGLWKWRSVRLFLGWTWWTPRTLMLLVLGGIGGFHAYYNSYFDSFVFAPFAMKGAFEFVFRMSLVVCWQTASLPKHFSTSNLLLIPFNLTQQQISVFFHSYFQISCSKSLQKKILIPLCRGYFVYTSLFSGIFLSLATNFCFFQNFPNAPWMLKLLSYYSPTKGVPSTTVETVETLHSPRCCVWIKFQFNSPLWNTAP